MNDRVRRAIRTLIQGVPPAGIIAGMIAFGVPLNEAQGVALMVVLTALSSFLLNLLEDETGLVVGPSKEA